MINDLLNKNKLDKKMNFKTFSLSFKNDIIVFFNFKTNKGGRISKNMANKLIIEGKKRGHLIETLTFS